MSYNRQSQFSHPKGIIAMIDIKLIREDRQTIEEKIRRKDPDADLSTIFDLDHRIRSLKTKVEQLKSERNKISKQIGEMKRKG